MHLNKAALLGLMFICLTSCRSRKGLTFSITSKPTQPGPPSLVGTFKDRPPRTYYGKGLELNIMHINDFHSNFEGITNKTSPCKEKHRKANECFGGIAKLVSMVKEKRQEDPGALLLGGGDFYHGTSWYTLLKSEPVIRFMNMLNFTATSLGNHEFDDGIDGLTPFLNRFNSEIICANIDASQEPSMKGKFRKSITTQIKGHNVGIIGYLTPATAFVSNPGNVKFLDIVESVQKEAAHLEREKNVSIIIALGHAGIEVDKQIAREVPQVDIVVGGHTDTLMYNGDPPIGPKENVLAYPIEITSRKRHSPALVVQDYAYGAYLGYLSVKFDQQGNVNGYRGNPIPLDSSVEDDKETVEAMKSFLPALKKAEMTVVGEAAENITGTRCRSGQCPVGSLVADSFAYYFKNINENLSKEPTLAVVNSGAVRSDIKTGNITFDNILHILPFSGDIERTRMNGSLLRELFEYSVSNYETDRNKINNHGRFFQVSDDVRVVYNMQAPSGSRVHKLSVYFNGTFQPVENDKFYNVITLQFLTKGGDGFVTFEKAERFPLATYKNRITLREYINVKSPIRPTVDGRILFSIECEEKTFSFL